MMSVIPGKTGTEMVHGESQLGPPNELIIFNHIQPCSAAAIH